ncbi:unnamed protein product [Musa textilis]
MEEELSARAPGCQKDFLRRFGAGGGERGEKRTPWGEWRVGRDGAQPRSFLRRTCWAGTQGEEARPALFLLDVSHGAGLLGAPSARENVLPAGGGRGRAPEEQGGAGLEAIGDQWYCRPEKQDL